MSTTSEKFLIESKTPYGESKIWQFNRDFYQENGISAWSKDLVPHHMTSNSFVGRTYAQLIFSLLQDLGTKGKTDKIVYLIELGAGHARLAFHILKHLDKLIASSAHALPPYCYVLSDIVEDNLTFFEEHRQLKTYYEKGLLDYCFFDAFHTRQLKLRRSNLTIDVGGLDQVLVAIGNYFFDSFPNDLFQIRNKEISSCSVEIYTNEDPKGKNTQWKIDNMAVSYHYDPIDQKHYENPILNEILNAYSDSISDSYIFFPAKATLCLDNLRAFSNDGLVLLTMDKGYHELADLEHQELPDIVTHGSFSVWVNFHALSLYCLRKKGQVHFPSSSNFHLEIGCLMFLQDSASYHGLHAAYTEYVNNFGPDDFNSLKHLTYTNLSRLTMKELIALYRLSSYDSTFFIKLLPQLKQLMKQLEMEERRRLLETFGQVWDMYFHIDEEFDLAYEIGGMLYDLAFYKEALAYFERSTNLYGLKPDIYYNEILCFYQLRQDVNFHAALSKAKLAFPDFPLFRELDKLDMSS